jgi:hypothetical protein
MKVVKKELKDRQFTPYEIIITIDNEPEHKALVGDVNRMKHETRDYIRMFTGRNSALNSLLNEIIDHKK